jgi:hypothetical protein
MNKTTNLAIVFFTVIFLMLGVYICRGDIRYVDGPFSFQTLEIAFYHGAKIVLIIFICSLISSVALVLNLKFFWEIINER